VSDDDQSTVMTVAEGAPEKIKAKVEAWYGEVCTQLTKYGLPHPAVAALKSFDDMWMASLYWSPDASNQLVSVSASYIRGDDFRAMLSCRPKRRDPGVLISWDDPMWAEVRPLIQALGRTLLRNEEDRRKAREDWESIDPNRRASWEVE
jgi:hypothetical protein